MLNRKEDWQAAFGKPDAAFDARVQQTLNHLEEGKTMKKFTVRTVVLVFALILALTGVVYAAANWWTVADYFNNRYGDNVNAPKDFDSGYRLDYTQELDGLTFHIRDAYVEGGVFNAIVEVRRTDGKPALIRGEDCMEDDPIGMLYLDLEDDQRTVAQYAKEKGLPMYWVMTDFDLSDAQMDYWMEGDNQFACFYSAENVPTKNGQATLQWTVLSYAEDGAWHKQSMEITLPVKEITRREVTVNQPVEGLPVILDSVTLREGRMCLYVDYSWHIDEKIGDEEAAKKLKECDINLWFRLIDPETGKELPGGATLGGQTGSQDDIHYLQSGDSVAADYAIGDTLYIQPYDAWEKTTYGVIEAKLQ